MKNDRIQFVITLLAAATLAMSLYFRVVFDSGITQWIQEPPLLKTIVAYLISKGMGEKNLKLVIIVAPVLAAYLYRFYSDRKINVKKTLAFTIIGLLIILYPFKNLVHLPVLVGMPLIIVGFLLYIRSLMRLSIWFFSKRLEQDQFNQKNQSFPQTTRKYEGKYNFALEYDFYLNGKKRTGQLNFVNIFRSVFVWGIMGSGKTFSFISPIIYELIQKDFSMMVYDLKFPSLSSKVYGYYQTAAPKELDFYQICTTDMRYSHRCNPIAPRYIPSITEIEKICDNVMTNLKRPDESESAFFKGTAMGLFVGLVALSKEMEEKHGLEVCSLPHVSILASVKAKYLLPLLLAKKDIIMKVSSLRDAFEGGAAMEQLVGITASLQEKLSRLYQLDAFYIFSGSGDFSLDLNQPDQKKVVTVGCDKDKAEVMAPYLSMIVETVGKEANKPNKAPFAAILDELSSFYYGGLVDYLESGRENLCALVAGIQGMEQLEKKYPRAEANSIIGIQGTIICGMSGVKTATEVSKRIGRTNQKKTGLNQNLEGGQTLSHSFFMNELIPIDRISNFSQGEFCGVVADTLEDPIEQKRFWGKFKKHHCHNTKKQKNMPLIHDFWNNEAQELFKEHWKEMMRTGFFVDFIDALDKGDMVFISKSVNFYIRFLRLSKEDLNYLIKKNNAIQQQNTKIQDKEQHEKGIKGKQSKKGIKDNSKFAQQKFLAEYFSDRLETVIIENEKHQFLSAHLERMYNEVETWIKKEYKEVTGESIDGDLFNLNDFQVDDLTEVPF